MQIKFPQMNIKGWSINTAVKYLRTKGINIFWANFNDYNSSAYVVIA